MSTTQAPGPAPVDTSLVPAVLVTGTAVEVLVHGHWLPGLVLGNRRLAHRWVGLVRWSAATEHVRTEWREEIELRVRVS